MGITLDKLKTVFDALEGIFRQEENQTLSRFKVKEPQTEANSEL